MQVNLHDTKTHLCRYVDQVLAGEEVMIGKGNVWCIHQPLPARCSAPRSISPKLSALIREAIDAYLHQQQHQGRLARLRQGRGLWAKRTDLPDWSALRSELDRAPADLSP